MALDAVSRDAVQERPDGSPRWIVPRAAFHQNQKDFLRHILGDGGRPAHVQREAVNPGLLPPEESCEGFFLARQHATQEVLILLLVAITVATVREVRRFFDVRLFWHAGTSPPSRRLDALFHSRDRGEKFPKKCGGALLELG
jgi:hypothetical protein